MVTYFNKSDLVKFGEYLLSEERKNLIKSHPGFEPSTIEHRLKQVSHADVANWIEKQKKIN